jgi:glycosyltransferase involved in cell wall biosynthesis
MTSRKVLILTFHFPPSSASGTLRVLGFVRHLPGFDWGTVVVAPPRVPWEPTDQALADQIPSEAVVYKVPYPEGWMWKPLRRLAPLGVWFPGAWTACRRAIREHQPAAIFTSGPPHLIHLLGRHVRNRYDLPWIADFRDPWIAGDPSTFSKKIVPKTWEYRAEMNVMRDADAIVTNTPGAQSLLRQAFPEYAAKMASITNGYDPGSFVPNAVAPFSRGTLEITHLGEIYANRDPAPLLEAIRSLGPSSRPKGLSVRVRFVGRLETAQKRLEEAIQAGGLEDTVELCGQIPYSASLRAMVQADILLLLDSPGRKAGVPAKLYEYIGAGRPILALAESDGDVAWVLRESGILHRIAPPRDPDAIRKAILELLDDPTAANLLSATVSSSRFARDSLAAELADLLNWCVERRLENRPVPPLSRVAPGQVICPLACERNVPD